MTAWKRLICLLCSLILAAINITVFAVQTIDNAPLDAPNSNYSAVYADVLNDYINCRGVISDEHPYGFTGSRDSVPNGLVYADIVNFENNKDPYLVLFLSDSEKNSASCHIWGYDADNSQAKEIASIDRRYSSLTERRGCFALGWNDAKRYIVYKELDDEETVSTEYFTVVNGEAFQYVTDPSDVSEAAVINFTNDSFRSDVDISDYNEALTQFFDKLKNAAADSVTYTDVFAKLDEQENDAITYAVEKASSIGNFDILSYNTIEEYEAALDEQRLGDRFYLISSVYSLDDELYYVRFSTDRSYYNYALLRKTERAELYQILKVRMDCIPLGDRELKALHDSYSKSALLYKKAKSSADAYTAPTRAPEKSDNFIGLPKMIHMPKLIGSNAKKPAAYLSAALTVMLMTGLWVFMYGSDEDEI
jgi:hypothetical protein